MDTVNIFWFRRDLRLHDNAGLYHTLKDKNPVIPIFIFDRNILDKLENKQDRRVKFIYETVIEIQQQLKALGSSLAVYYNFPEKVFEELLSKYAVQKVYTNHDYEPYAIDRDQKMNEILKFSGVQLVTFKDQVIFEKNEITKDDNTPYTIFTPYSRKWKSKLNNFYLRSYPNEKYFYNFYKQSAVQIPSLNSMGFKETEESFPSKIPNDILIKNYYKLRNFPSADGTSKLGVHLRFGTISIRELAVKAKNLNETFLNELIWRDFYHSILWHFPPVGRHKAFKSEYENIEWRNNEKEFACWCEGKTGYPIVDAGMRELNQTGFMHNRVQNDCCQLFIKTFIN
ncbi:MAG: deoxyribodipyrimidine photo-lyase [Chitinophagaceae bacterium]